MRKKTLEVDEDNKVGPAKTSIRYRGAGMPWGAAKGAFVNRPYGTVGTAALMVPVHALAGAAASSQFAPLQTGMPQLVAASAL